MFSCKKKDIITNSFKDGRGQNKKKSSISFPLMKEIHFETITAMCSWNEFLSLGLNLDNNVCSFCQEDVETPVFGTEHMIGRVQRGQYLPLII